MVEEEYNKNNKILTRREQERLQTEAKILDALLIHTNLGIHHIRLAEIIGIDRKNLTPHMKRLIKQKFARRELGQRGKYFPSDEIYKIGRLEGYLYGFNLRMLFLWQLSLALNSLYIDKERISSPEKILEIMSTVIGRSIMYGILLSIVSSLDLKDQDRMINRDLLDREWLKYAMSAAVPDFASIFKYIIRKYVSKKTGSTLNKRDIAIFQQAFKKLYPEFVIPAEALRKVSDLEELKTRFTKYLLKK